MEKSIIYSIDFLLILFISIKINKKKIMKKLSLGILFMIIAVQITLGHIIGQSFKPLDTSEWFIWAILPAIIILGFGFAFGGPLWEKTDGEILKKNSISTIRDLLLWFWLIASTLFLILTIYLLSQALLPVSEQTDHNGDITMILSSMGAYIMTIYGLWRRLKKNWK